MGFSLVNWVFHDLFRVRKQAFEYQIAFAAGTDPSAAAAIPAKTGYRVRMTDVIFNVTTSTAQTLIVRDDATTPVVIASFASGTAVGTHHLEYGELGFPATVSKNIDIAASAAGYAGTLQIFGYYEAIGPFTPSSV